MRRLLDVAEVVLNAWHRAADWWDDERDDLAWRRRRAWWSVRTSAHGAVTGVLRLFDSTIERRNSDKPHRCPGCHTIECSEPKRFYRLYRCLHCGVRHWPGWRWQRSADACVMIDAPDGFPAHPGAYAAARNVRVTRLTPPPDRG